MVEHRTAVPVVIGSNPIVPSFWRRYNKTIENINEEKRRIEESYDIKGSHGVGAAYEILVLGTPVRIWVGPLF